MIDPFEARDLLLGEVERLDEEEISVRAALHRTLSSSIHTDRAHPASDNSAMDGFALRSADTAGASPERPVKLRIIGESTSAGPFEGSVKDQEAVEISTGGPVPDGADAIVPVEHTHRSGGRVMSDPSADRDADPGAVQILREASSGAHIRPRGEEFLPGDEILPAGIRLNPAAIGLLSSLGHRIVPVFRRPRVLILITGQEFVASGDPSAAGDANGPMVDALCRETGAEVAGVRYVGDATDALRQVLEEWAPKVDVILSTGGASVGPHDLVAEAWEAIGAETFFWKVAMKPGKPVRAGCVRLESGRRTILLALPGNPQSVLAGFETFAEPLLARLAGEPDDTAATVRIPSARVLPPDSRTRLLRARIQEGDGSPTLDIPTGQGSGMLRHAATCPFVAVVPPSEREIEAGEILEARPRPEGLAGRSWTPSPDT